MQHEHNHHDHYNHSSYQVAAHATIHCPIGCSIGEFTGLAIGVALGFSIFWIIVLGTSLAFITGMTLAALPIMKNMNKNFLNALKVIRLGEVISIAVMEIAMNFTRYFIQTPIPRKSCEGLRIHSPF